MTFTINECLNQCGSMQDVHEQNITERMKREKMNTLNLPFANRGKNIPKNDRGKIKKTYGGQIVAALSKRISNEHSRAEIISLAIGVLIVFIAIGVCIWKPHYQADILRSISLTFN